MSAVDDVLAILGRTAERNVELIKICEGLRQECIRQDKMVEELQDRVSALQAEVTRLTQRSFLNGLLDY